MITANLKSLFESERNIPYHIPLSCNEKDHCCSGKHERLFKAFTDAGIETRYRVCWFRWSDMALPPEVSLIPHDDEYSHVYLEVKSDDSWVIIDATWDPGLASILPINEWVEGENMTVAVPVTKTLSPEDSAALMAAITPHDIEIDLEKHTAFYRALNEWLEKIRSKKTYATS